VRKFDTDAALSAITEAELRNLEAEHAEHAGGAWGVLRHRWIWYSCAGWLIKALRACRRRSEAKDAAIETLRSLAGYPIPGLPWPVRVKFDRALAALDKEMGDDDS